MPKGIYVRRLSAHANHAGERYGRLVTMRVFDRQNGHVRWVCQCDCGKQHIAARIHLRTGAIRSCGCYNDERRLERNTTHGQALSVAAGGWTAEYRAWRNIKSRCHNPRCNHYRLYGARGIQMCAEWLNDFPAFFAYVGPKPSPAHSIDRIDNNGNYEPGNVRWTTSDVQILNKRNTGRFLDINDTPISLQSVADYLAMPRASLKLCLQRSGVWQ